MLAQVMHCETRRKKLQAWEFANNVCGRYVMWQCKLCSVTKSRGAPRIREHFLGGPKKACRMCTHPQAPTVAKRLREEIAKKSKKRQYAKAFAANAVQDEDNNSYQINANVTRTSAIEDYAKDSTVPSSVSSKQSNEEVRPPLVQM